MIQSDHSYKPSTLAGLLRAVKAMMSLSADKTPIKIGEQHLTGGISHPSIILVPDVSGRIAPAIQSGHAAASWVHGCDVHVRAKPGMDEEDVFIHAYDLADKVIGTLALAGSGRLEWGPASATSPTPSNNLAAELTFSFTFQRDIPHIPEMWKVPIPQLDTTRPIDDTRTLARYTPADEPTIETLEGEPIVTPTVTPQEG